MGQIYDRTRDQMNSWRWDNPRTFGDQVDRFTQENIKSGKVKGNNCEDGNNDSDVDSGKGKGKEVEKKMYPEKKGKETKSERLKCSNKLPQSVAKAIDSDESDLCGSDPSGYTTAPIALIAPVTPVAHIAPVTPEVEDSDSDTIYEMCEEELEG
ncbi:hypothetical protein K440DRAFT_636636 [Wilcoxina mikolae CBS 423.85]|nr:hypothetical protein K440DRAFT_636636 [Wilcoxina mikolae CBS 423.85]